MSVKGISWNQTVFSVKRTTTHLAYATFNVFHRITLLVTIHVIQKVVTKYTLKVMHIAQHSLWTMKKKMMKMMKLMVSSPSFCIIHHYQIMQMVSRKVPLQGLVQELR